MILLDKMRADLNTLWVLRFEVLDTALKTPIQAEKQHLRALADKLRSEYFIKKQLYNKQRIFNSEIKNELNLK